MIQLPIKLLIIFIFFLVLSLSIGYFLILPPKVIDLTPANGSGNVSLGSSLIIKFDKPLKRQEVKHYIFPTAYGEWKFEDPLIKNHLFRTLIFTPAINFEPDTQYQVKLENIIGPLGIDWPRSFSFNFKTKAIEPKKSIEYQPELPPIKQPEPRITLLDIDLDWQDHPLSCEAASLKMALAGKDIYVSEDDIMEKIGYDLTPRKNNIWGNPHQAYVGNIDGKICSTGYGVYWEPVAKAANHWREAEALSGWEIEDLIKEMQLGNPVIVWGTLPVEPLHDCSWYTPKGKYIKAFKETHVRVAIGFIGDSENPSKVILNDPLAGRLYWSIPYFLTNWKVFGYSGVVIR